MNIKVKRLHKDAKLPKYGSVGAAAFDFYALTDLKFSGLKRKGNKIPLGLAFEIPKGYAMMIVPRSSIGLKTLLRQSNSIGIIDSDYRGEVSALYDYDGWLPRTVFRKGDRIAQGFLVKLPTVIFKAVGNLSETKRGTGGFGSTGKR